jgi:RNA-directed DNA polymerase
VNTDAPFPDADEAWWRVQKIQTKLLQWATDDLDRRFDDLWNLAYDPDVLADAWHRVRSNRGARSAGVDGETVFYVSVIRGEQAFLSELRDDLKARRFQPVPVREAMIPKPGGKRRRLGPRSVVNGRQHRYGHHAQRGVERRPDPPLCRGPAGDQ